MLYIFVGIAAAVLLIVLVFADKFTPLSDMMSSFTKKNFKLLIIALIVVAAGSTTYGVYALKTNKPHHITIEVNGESKLVFGEIGELGYFSPKIVRKGEVAALHLVSWQRFGEDSEVILEYPSGEKTSVSELVQVEHPELYIYKMPPHTFTEIGKVEIYVKRGEERLDFTINVREPE